MSEQKDEEGEYLGMPNRADIKDQILQLLSGIEQEYGVRILYACESGSRAWGFASQDSDFDVRFIYVHPRDWYMAIDVERKRDVIEIMEGELDFSGWDLRKALHLLYKGNPPLVEWLGSPIVYLDRDDFADRLGGLLPHYFLPTAAMYHYLHMAQGNYREYLRGERVRTKKYLYVLRPLLAIRWIRDTGSVPPVKFVTMVNSLLPKGELQQDVHKLLVRKIAGQELDDGPRIPSISKFIEAELAGYERMARVDMPMKSDMELLNVLFRDILTKSDNRCE